MAGPEQTVLVLGAYGLIGLSVCRRLKADGHAVRGLARSAAKADALIPGIPFHAADLADLTKASDWLDYLEGVDAIVNASGVLQSGLGNDPDRAQHDAIVALIAACEAKGDVRFVQISAPGVTDTASTAFFRSKARADHVLAQSSLVWTILRPGLVLSPQSYGGTALLRMLAAFPVIQPVFMADAPVQTVHVDDVASAVSAALFGKLDAQDIDLVEANAHSLLEVLLAFRKWLGFAPPKAVWAVPRPIGWMTAKIADALGWLGWSSALRSTSLAVLKDGVTGRASGTVPVTSLQASLERLPSTRQERLAARLALVFPVLVATLSLFWIVSGVIGLVRMDAAASVLDGELSPRLATAFVIGGALADMVVGAMIAFRPTLRKGCLFGILVALGYIGGSAVLTPGLWLDPLGPMVKVFPAIALMFAVSAMADER